MPKFLKLESILFKMKSIRLLFFLLMSLKGYSQQTVLTTSGEGIVLNYLPLLGGTISGTLGVAGNLTISGTLTTGVVRYPNTDGTANQFLMTNGTGIASFGSIPTLNQNTTGNAATANSLSTPRNINGVEFDGTSNITLTAAAGTLTGSSLASNVVSSSLTSVGTLASLNRGSFVVSVCFFLF